MAFPSDSARTKDWSTEVLTDADLEAQLDLLHNYFLACLNSSTGHSHDGTSNQGPKINITNLTVSSQALGDLIYASSSSAWARKGGNTTTTKKFLNQTGNGTASAAPSWDALVSTDLPSGTALQCASSVVTAYTDIDTTTYAMFLDTSIPQNTEGREVATVDITAKATGNIMLIEWNCFMGCNSGTPIVCALFIDSTADAIAATAVTVGNNMTNFTLRFKTTAADTSSHTYKIRIGPTAGGNTIYLNQDQAGNNLFGSVAASVLTVTEYKA